MLTTGLKIIDIEIPVYFLCLSSAKRAPNTRKNVAL